MQASMTHTTIMAVSLLLTALITVPWAFILTFPLIALIGTICSALALSVVALVDGSTNMLASVSSFFRRKDATQADYPKKEGVGLRVV